MSKLKSVYERLNTNLKSELQASARKYLWVLDFELGRVFMYNIRRTDLQCEDYEDLLVLKGHKPTNCEWMVCKSDRIYR